MEAGGQVGSGRNGGDGYRFGPFVVDATAYTLTRDGEPQALEPKAFAVLLHLLRHAGELVRHDDLLDAVWGHRHVTAGVLTRAIAQLRHVLEDDSHRPQYIQTQHALGYRFIGELKSRPRAGEGPAREAGASAAEPAQVQATETMEMGDTHHAAAVDMSRPLASAAAPTATAAVRTTMRSRVRRLWLPAALLLAAITAWGLYALNRRAPVRPGDASIAVLPFTSLSDDRNDSYFAEGLAVELHDALASVPGLKVAACRSESACGTRGADARRIGKLLGVATLLDADVRREGQRVRINARLSDTRTGYTLWSGSYERELSGVFALQKEIADEVVRSLPGIQPGSGDALARRLQPTRDVAAYDAYLKGVQQLSSRRDGEAAIGFFNEALAADAGFARAQAGICRGEIVTFEGTRDSAAYQRAEAACQRAAQMDPALREVNLALGDLHQAHGEPAQAIEYYKQAREDKALKPDAYLGMARAEAAQKRNDVALEYFERARQLRPGDAAIYRSLGFHHYVNGDLPKAIDTYRVATELEPNNEETWSSFGALCMLNADNACASDAYMRSLAIKPNYGALVNLGNLRFDAGIYDEAASLYRRATQLDPSDYRTWGNLGDALSARPATTDQARDPYQRAAQMAQAYIDIKPHDAHAIAVLAWYRANLGQEQESRELLRRANALNVEQSDVAFWAAQSLALLGDGDGARAALQQALEGGVNRQRIEASPTLSPLLAAVVQQRTAGDVR
jgi:TolB-like protein/DNA-binding winged helix-turn-helix (wHTH) protein/Flp pilus assembly protein TadD